MAVGWFYTLFGMDIGLKSTLIRFLRRVRFLGYGSFNCLASFQGIVIIFEVVNCRS